MNIVEYYRTINRVEPVTKYFKTLMKKGKKDVVDEFLMAVSLLEEHGHNLKKKMSGVKQLKENGLYQIRISDSRFIYFHYKNGRYVLLHAFEKKKNGPDHDEIKKALKYKKDYENRFG